MMEKTKKVFRGVLGILLSAAMLAAPMPAAFATGPADGGGAAALDTTPVMIDVLSEGMKVKDQALAFLGNATYLNNARDSIFAQPELYPNSYFENFTLSYRKVSSVPGETTETVKKDDDNTRVVDTVTAVTDTTEQYSIAQDGSVTRKTIVELKTKTVTTTTNKKTGAVSNGTGYKGEKTLASTDSIAREGLTFGSYTYEGATYEYVSADAAGNTLTRAMRNLANEEFDNKAFAGDYYYETPWGLRQFGGNSCYVDLGGYYVITGVAWSGKTGTIDFNLQIGDPGNWQTLSNCHKGYLDQYYVRNLADVAQLPIDTPAQYAYDPADPATAPYKNATRYVRVQSDSGNNISRIVLYGYAVGGLTELDQARGGPSYRMEYNHTDFTTYDAATGTYHEGKLAELLRTDPAAYLAYVQQHHASISGSLTVGEGIGANIFGGTSPDSTKILGNTREFHTIRGDISVDGDYGFEFGGDWGGDTDADYKEKWQMGLNLIPCLQQTTKWMAGIDSAKFDQLDGYNWKPVQMTIRTTTVTTNVLTSATSTNEDGTTWENVTTSKITAVHDSLTNTTETSYFTEIKKHTHNLDGSTKVTNVQLNMTDPEDAILSADQAAEGETFTTSSTVKEEAKAAVDTTDPASYAKHANYFYNVAARYGSNTAVDPATLRIDTSEKVVNGKTVQETKKIGLGYLKAVENFNEHNKNWEGENSYLSPEEFSAMCSADYDGHEGTVRFTDPEDQIVYPVGIKNADPGMQLATAGFVGSDSYVLEYLDQMKDWFSYHRDDGYFVPDIINVHTYLSKDGPEATEYQELMENLVAWVRQNAPGREIWLSEINCDSMDLNCVEVITSEETQAPDGSITTTETVELYGGLVDGVPEQSKYSSAWSAQQKGQYDNRRFQLGNAQRNLRMFLIGLSAGLDRISMFEIRDEGPGVYANSGLTFFPGNDSKKLGWYFVSAATAMLKNAKPAAGAENGRQVLSYQLEPTGTGVDTETVTISPSRTTPYDFGSAEYQEATKIPIVYYDLKAPGNGSDTREIYVYKYVDQVTGEDIYAVWSASSNGSVIQNFTLDVGACDHVTMTTPFFNMPEGKKQMLTVTDGTVTFDVSETVAFIKVSGAEDGFDSYPSGLLRPIQMQLGEASYSNKEKADYDGTEIIDVAGKALYYRDDLVSLDAKASDAVSKIAAALSDALSAAEGAAQAAQAAAALGDAASAQAASQAAQAAKAAAQNVKTASDALAAALNAHTAEGLAAKVEAARTAAQSALDAALAAAEAAIAAAAPSDIAAVKTAAANAKTSAQNVQKAADALEGVFGSMGVSAMHQANAGAAAVDTAVSYLGKVTASIDDPCAAAYPDTVVGKTAQAAAFAAKAAYSAAVAASQLCYEVPAATMLGAGVYYNSAADEVAGIAGNAVLVNDTLLTAFAKLFDEEVANVPQTIDDFTYWPQPGKLGSPHSQDPVSSTAFISNYLFREYPYDVLLALDDYYTLDAMAADYIVGSGTIKIYDASETGTGALLGTAVLNKIGENWYKGYANSNVLANSVVYFEEGASSIATNKIRLEVTDCVQVGEIAIYGTKAYSKVGAPVAPVPGELSAEGIVKKLKVTYNSQGGQAVAPMTGIPMGTTLTQNNLALPTLPNRTVTSDEGVPTEYVFAGWYTDSACTAGHAFTADTVIENSMTVYAKWAELAAAPQIVLYPGMLTTTDPEPWLTTNLPTLVDEQSSRDVGGGNPTTGCNTKEIYIDLGLPYLIKQSSLWDGYGTGELVMYYSNDNETWVEMYASDLHSYNRWLNGYYALESQGITARYLRISKTGTVNELILYGTPAVDVSELSMTVQFDSQLQGVTVPAATVLYGDTVTLPAPVKYGYTFEGWYTTDTYQTPFASNTPVTANLTLYAKWTQLSSLLPVDLSGGFSLDTGTAVKNGEGASLFDAQDKYAATGSDYWAAGTVDFNSSDWVTLTLDETREIARFEIIMRYATCEMVGIEIQTKLGDGEWGTVFNGERVRYARGIVDEFTGSTVCDAVRIRFTTTGGNSPYVNVSELFLWSM